jgi:hypothetical protein
VEGSRTYYWELRGWFISNFEKLKKIAKIEI